MDSDKLTFNDHQAAELLHLRAQVAELKRAIELLKLDNMQLTEANYAMMLREKSVRG